MTRAEISVLLLLIARLASAEPAVTIRNNGPAANRINMVILGDGYTAGELVKYGADVDVLVSTMFQQSPYAEYARFFNITRVDVTSTESGASHPELGITRSTALGAFYNCGGVQRVICVNFTSVNTIVGRSVPAGERDAIVVLVNDPQYGGSGGSVIVASTDRQVVELVLHEAGHTLGLLADEYSVSPPACVNTVEPSAVNIARDIGRTTIKWAHWIEASTPLPTTGTVPAVPGAYEGAQFCTGGLYRPTFDSKMRTLNRPFEQINTEQLIRRFYSFVEPFDSALPAATGLTAACGDVLSFSVQPLSTSNGPLPVKWTVDNAAAGSGSELRLAIDNLTRGAHSVDVEVRDETPAVRRDPQNALVERRHWDLTVVRRQGILGFPEASICQRN